MPSALYDDLWRVTFEGHLDVDEIFSHGWWITAESGATAADLHTVWDTAITELLDTASTAGLTTMRQYFSSIVSWESCTLRPYSKTTMLPTADPNTAEIEESGTGGQTLPFQDSCAVTVRNGRTIGRARYNRWFPPPFVTAILTTDGRVFTTVCDDFGTWYNNFMVISEAASPASSFCYASALGNDVTALNSMYMGDVIDTHRSRRNALTEHRTTTIFT